MCQAAQPRTGDPCAHRVDRDLPLAGHPATATTKKPDTPGTGRDSHSCPRFRRISARNRPYSIFPIQPHLRSWPSRHGSLVRVNPCPLLALQNEWAMMRTVCRTSRDVSSAHGEWCLSNNLHHPYCSHSFALFQNNVFPTVACLHNSHSSSHVTLHPLDIIQQTWRQKEVLSVVLVPDPIVFAPWSVQVAERVALVNSRNTCATLLCVLLLFLLQPCNFIAAAGSKRRRRLQWASQAVVRCRCACHVQFYVV